MYLRRLRYPDTWVMWEDGLQVGEIFLWGHPDYPQVAYFVYPFARNKGYATSAVKRLVRICKRRKQRFRICIASNNPASMKVAKKCGFYFYWNYGEISEFRREEWRYD